MSSKYKRALVLYSFGMLLVHALVLWNSRDMIREGYPDFTSFYAAARIVHAGQGSQLYDPATQWNVQQEFAGRVAIRVGPLPYFHPPFEALLFAPFAHHSYLAAFWIWNTLNVAILFAVSWMLRSHLPGLQQLPLWLNFVIPFALSPICVTLLQGQDSVLLLLIYVLAYLALKKKADFRAGCWLAFGLFKPHLLLPFIVILLLQRTSLVQSKLKLISGFLAVALILGAISAAIVGWSGLLHYPGQIWILEHHAGLILPGDIPNLRGLLDATFSRWISEYAVSTVIAIASAVLLLGVRRSWPTGETRSDLVFSYGLLATVLVSYHIFAQDLSILVLPFFLILNGVVNREVGSVFEKILPIALLLFGLVLPMQQIHLVNLLALVVLGWTWAITRYPAPLAA